MIQKDMIFFSFQLALPTDFGRILSRSSWRATRVGGTICGQSQKWAVLPQMIKGQRFCFDAVTLPPGGKKTYPVTNIRTQSTREGHKTWACPFIFLFVWFFFEELLQMSEENERGRIFTDSWSESNRGGEKKTMGRRGAGREGGKGGCIFLNFPENISYLRWGRRGEGRRSRRGRGRSRRAFSSQQPELPPTTRLPRHFSFRFGIQKELAGGVVNLFPM